MCHHVSGNQSPNEEWSHDSLKSKVGTKITIETFNESVKLHPGALKDEKHPASPSRPHRSDPQQLPFSPCEPPAPGCPPTLDQLFLEFYPPIKVRKLFWSKSIQLLWIENGAINGYINQYIKPNTYIKPSGKRHMAKCPWSNLLSTTHVLLRNRGGMPAVVWGLTPDDFGWSNVHSTFWGSTNNVLHAFCSRHPRHLHQLQCRCVRVTPSRNTRPCNDRVLQLL